MSLSAESNTALWAEIELADPEVSSRHLRSVMERAGARVAPPAFLRAVTEAYRYAQAKLDPASAAPRFHADASHQVLGEGIQQARTRLTGRARILVLGCGSDYAGCSAAYVEQVVRELMPGESIQSLDSLDFTRLNLKHTGGEFDVIVSHSLLHFIPELGAAVRRIAGMLARGGLYLMAHEPNARFWSNQALLEERRRMCSQRAARVLRGYWLSASTYVTKLRALVASKPITGMDRVVNRYLEDHYSLRAHLSPHEIARLVDPHKPSDGAHAFRIGLNGLDPASLRQLGLETSRLLWTKSYDHLGYADYKTAPAEWQERNRQLAALYPTDGVAWTALWFKL